MNKKIAVYGSLLTNLGNNRIINVSPNSKLISTEIVSIPFGMVSLGAFPALYPSKTSHNIKIEIFEVDNNTYNNIEKLEGYPFFYQKTKINTSKGKVEIYIIEKENFEHTRDTKVISGDWKSYLNIKNNIK